ncbi:hypothetical protein AVEN_151301-1 [Araneus ventricosus]|uniref:Uncharacterized protein n=1 Tax=Araneus ventricosus TaxID=182803 RepID=A0A4Y2RPK0_ARAVE|nr:hypothetical protein AVEN_151301-1 [Araneus ventricosus]
MTIAWIHQKNRQVSKIFLINLGLHQALPRHNIDELAINRNTIQRYREDFSKTKAAKIKELFKENEPSLISVHWDSKLLPALNVRDLKSERLPIIVTYKDEEKLLGVPKLENSSGKEQAMAVWNVLRDWRIKLKFSVLAQLVVVAASRKILQSTGSASSKRP